jgi:hypothetical protein
MSSLDTVRRFCDRRYEYKGLHKTWKKNLDTAVGEGRSMAVVDEAKKIHLVYARFTNHQYHDLDASTGEYVVHSENSIFDRINL